MLVSIDADVEDWLTRSAKAYRALTDCEYRALVPKWRRAFFSTLDFGEPVEAKAALAELERRLPSSLYVFNGLSIPQVGNATTSHPCAYFAEDVTEIDTPLVNGRDLVLTEPDLAFAYVGTHEWQAFGKPRFIESAG